ncbi:MAG: hypothetical protein M0C28_47855 [Candidatus Moduliflexus flocculans]|nr:hypothetical protein [Candidatus Moduliflexus flocculans]
MSEETPKRLAIIAGHGTLDAAYRAVRPGHGGRGHGDGSGHLFHLLRPATS